MLNREVGLIAVVVGLVLGCHQDPSPSLAPPTSRQIGHAGGIVEVTGGAKVAIPAGALAADTKITVSEVESDVPLPDGLFSAGKAYSFEPHGLTFAVPVTITLPFTGDSVALQVVKLDSALDTTWQLLGAGAQSGASLSVLTTSFSIYQTVRVEPGTILPDAGSDVPPDETPYLPHEIIVAGQFPVASPYVVQGGPVVFGGLVYWSPGDGTIKRVGLVPGDQVETIYSEPGAQVVLHAVGAGFAFFGRDTNLESTLGRVPVDGGAAEPSWTSSMGNTSNNHWLVARDHLYAGGVRVNVSTGVLDKNSWDTFGYVDGTCVLSTDGGRALCFSTEVNFDAATQTEIVSLSSAGASNLGAQAANATGWFVLDGDESFTGESRLTRVPYGGGAGQLVLTGAKGTNYVYIVANDEHLFVRTDKCHQFSFVELQGSFAVQEKDVYLSFEGPCVGWMHIDDTFAYLNTAIGFVRVRLADLRLP